MYEKEKIIKEKRLAEATDKQYLGLEGKFGTILKFLGHPIQDFDGGYFTSTEFPDVYAVPKDEDEIPTGDTEVKSIEYGMTFSGLNRGYHLEIFYLDSSTDKEYAGCTELVVSYKGYTVYREMEGELVLFYPLKEWEDIINKLYAIAREIYKNKMTTFVKDTEVEFKEEKLSFLQKLRRRWNI